MHHSPDRAMDPSFLRDEGRSLGCCIDVLFGSHQLFWVFGPGLNPGLCSDESISSISFCPKGKKFVKGTSVISQQNEDPLPMSVLNDFHLNSSSNRIEDPFLIRRLYRHWRVRIFYAMYIEN